MSELFTQILYYSVIALVGIVMTVSPRRFIGKAKYDEQSFKAEKFIKRVGIGIIILSIILFIISVTFAYI